MITDVHAKPFNGFPLPHGYRLCCPACETFKMRRYDLPEVEAYRCLGPNCGYIASRLEVDSYKAMMMVEE
jgi:hypothetical protein